MSCIEGFLGCLGVHGVCVQIKKTNDRAQATVEFAVALPVCLILALVILQILFFCSECARFDALAQNALRICAVSHEDEVKQDQNQINQAVQEMIQKELSQGIESVQVSSSKEQGLIKYALLLDMAPNILGKPCSLSVFGFKLPHLEHTQSLVVSSYNPDIFRRA